jgi:CDP-diglyceride synthetase
MGPLLAWLPFLGAIVLAFVAGVVFARMNEGLRAGAELPERHTGASRLMRADTVVTAALFAFVLVVLLVWGGALVSVFTRRGG